MVWVLTFKALICKERNISESPRVLQAGCVLPIIIHEFKAGPLQQPLSFSQCARAKVMGCRDHFKDVLLIVWMLRDEAVE